MDQMDNRNDRNDRNDRNGGNRYNRDHHRGPRYGRRDGGGFQHGRGKIQRPLLTSSINGAGLSLIAVVLLMDKGMDSARLWLSGAVISFGVSAIISYVAQRRHGGWVEKVSDLFFLTGAVILIWQAAHLGGLLH